MSIFHRAIKSGKFATMAGMNVNIIHKYTPKSEAAALNNLDQQRKIKISTRDTDTS